MINLIPNQEKKKKVKDFYFRLAAVFIWALGFCVAFGAAVLLPTYFLTVTERTWAEEKVALQQNESPTPEDHNLTIAAADLDQKISLLERAEASKYLVSKKVVNEITVRKMADIKIIKFSYENGAMGRKVVIRGRAPSRERLLLFRRALEDDIAFKKVELPISNFVKGSNLEFTLTLIPS